MTMDMTPDIVVFIFLIQFLGYGVKGLIGFGNPLVASPLLAMRLDNLVITPGMLLMDCPVNAYITWKNRKNFNWRKVAPLVFVNLCGVIPGALLLKTTLPWVIKTALGVVVVLLGVEMATRSRRKVRQEKDSLWLRLGASFVSGVCAGLFGINITLVAYLQRVAKDYAEFKGSMCFLFFGENLFRLATYLTVGGFVTREALLFGAVSVPAAILAMFVAGRVAPHLDEKKLNRWAIVLFIFSGVSIIVKSLVFHA